MSKQILDNHFHLDFPSFTDPPIGGISAKFGFYSKIVIPADLYIETLICIIFYRNEYTPFDTNFYLNIVTV